MADPQTTNLQLNVPLNGADIGTWDVPVNNNMTQLDNVLCTVQSVALSNLPVTLSAGQYNSHLINFTGTLTGNVVITLPMFGRFWTMYNKCLGAATFSVTVKTSASTSYVALPPGEPIRVICDGTNTMLSGLGRIGTYLDMGSTSIPVWITASVPAPYLNCDGTAFSSATYPTLRDYLGSSLLPDSRSRVRYALDQGTNRANFNSVITGSTYSGNALIGQGNLPNYNLSVSDPGHTHGVSDPSHSHSVSDPGHAHNISAQFYSPSAAAIQMQSAPGFGAQFLSNTDGALTGISLFGAFTGIGINGAFTGIGVNSGGSGVQHSPPCYTGGLTLIRAG